MPAFRKSSSKQNIMPYIRSASSKLSITALSSTSSLSALFSSSISTSGSSKSIFASGIRGIMNGKQDKENTLPSPGPTPSPSISSLFKRSRTKKDKSNKGKEGEYYPEISAPHLTAESLEAVRARFTLVPLKSGPCTDEVDVVIVNNVDMSAPQKKGRSA